MTPDPFAMALAAHQTGDLDEAIRLYGLALQADPRRVHALSNLGAAHLQKGEMEHGVALLRQSLEWEPNQPHSLNNLANGLASLGRPDEALQVYETAIHMTPNQADALTNRARLLNDLGRAEDAVEAYAAAVHVLFDNVDLLHEQALLLYRLKRFAPAAEALARAAVLAPAVPAIHNDLGVMLEEIDRKTEALAAYDRALALDPAYIDAMNNRGMVLITLKRFDEALAQHQAAVAAAPGHAGAWHYLGASLFALGRMDEALHTQDRALALQPTLVGAWVRRGDVLAALRRFDEADAAYVQAQTLEPNNILGLWNWSMALLRQGRYAEGLPLYEHRWQQVLRTEMQDLPRPLWLGEEFLAGQTLLIHAEQGFGDALMMLRYAPLLARQGVRVLASVQDPLLELAAAVEGIAGVIPMGEPLPPYDRHIPMMSLPLAMGAGSGVFGEAPFIRVPDAKQAEWRERLGPRRRPRLGLIWSGNRDQSGDHHRSLTLARLAPFMDLDADIYSLQPEYRPEDQALLKSLPIQDLSADIKSFTDTAAAMQEMDLIVSTCTSGANLAGGLGLPFFALLSYNADWRWGLPPGDSPWYPTARLFRQSALGDWDGVIAAARAAADDVLSR